eukprot:TRINITY_DN825_c0_g1_i11.p3 TRINITY_DN825_c0_g1~~TRINITY_DN825_c0_g1_i11.p3  ORF type:complete len:106 (+),score=31.54 TRINITY_DN825_c0_g1_i11:879-1196(+)
MQFTTSFWNMRVTESENQNQQLTPESDSQQGSQQAPQPETNIEDLDVDGVVALLRKWDLEEIEAKFREKNINGRALLAYARDEVLLSSVIADAHDRTALRRKLGK